MEASTDVVYSVVIPEPTLPVDFGYGDDSSSTSLSSSSSTSSTSSTTSDIIIETIF
jgi:hypothetical protein